jgi:hypothetical protein
MIDTEFIQLVLEHKKVSFHGQCKCYHTDQNASFGFKKAFGSWPIGRRSYNVFLYIFSIGDPNEMQYTQPNSGYRIDI